MKKKENTEVIPNQKHMVFQPNDPEYKNTSTTTSITNDATRDASISKRKMTLVLR